MPEEKNMAIDPSVALAHEQRIQELEQERVNVATKLQALTDQTEVLTESVDSMSTDLQLVGQKIDTLTNQISHFDRKQKEKKERREQILKYVVPFITALFGVLLKFVFDRISKH